MTDQTPITPSRSSEGSRESWSRWLMALVAIVVVAGVTLAGVTVGKSSKAAGGATITVTGSGTVKGRPDTVSFDIGVQTTGATAVATLNKNNASTAALERSLRANGVTNKEMQTSDLEIYDNTNSSGQITGFTASDQLDVTMHAIADAGKAIDAAAKSVGNGIQLSGITFSISNESSLLAAARARAMENARVEASQIASGGHTTLGSIVKVTDQENTGSTGIVYPVYSAAEGTAAVPVESGSQSVNVQVTVVYSLKS